MVFYLQKIYAILYLLGSVNMVIFKIDKQFDNVTIQEFLSSFHLSKPKIYKLEIKKSIFINNKPASLENILKASDLISFDFKCLNTKKIIQIEGDIEVVYEDQDILILNKQPFILVHTDGITNDTLTNRIAFHYANHSNQILAVHRLDYETSGLLVFAKHPLSHAYLSYLFEKRKVNKTYMAYVENVMDKKSGWIKEPIGKDRHLNRQRVTKSGQKAETHYQVLKEFKDKTLCEINIIGGRKHQIRVHLAYLGHPVVGDRLYGDKFKHEKGLKLHFKNIQFLHPRTREIFEVDSKVEISL